MVLRRHLTIPSVLSLAAVSASIAIGLLALHLADGVTAVGGGSYRTEFIDAPTLQLAWLLPVIVGAAASWSVRIALVGVLGVAATQWWAMSVTVDRYAASGWADGLETLGYLFPIVVTAISLVAVLVGGLVGRSGARRRSAQDQ